MCACLFTTCIHYAAFTPKVSGNSVTPATPPNSPPLGPTHPTPLVPVVFPTYIVFLDKSTFSTKAEHYKEKIFGLEVFQAVPENRAKFSSVDNGEFHIGVVYQRLLKLQAGHTSFQYTAQGNFAEYAKTLKLREFVSVVDVLGAKSIKFKQEVREDFGKNMNCGCGGRLWAILTCNASWFGNSHDSYYLHSNNNRPEHTINQWQEMPLISQTITSKRSVVLCSQAVRCQIQEIKYSRELCFRER